MGNNITELVFILDRSGSMAGLERDTIGGFNGLIENQHKEPGECYVSTVLFSDTSKVMHDRVHLSDVQKMTDKDYVPCGCTALVDALGGAIHHISNIHKYARPEDVPEHTLFVIMTDGMENASHLYTVEQVNRMVQEKRTTCGWEFLFIGANIDAAQTATDFGIGADRAANYRADRKGTAVAFEAVSENVCAFRNHQPLPPNWSKHIDADFNNRK